MICADGTRMHKQTHNAHICTAICPVRSAYRQTPEPPENTHLNLSSRSPNTHLLPSVLHHPPLHGPLKSTQALISKPHPPSLPAHLPNYPASHSIKTLKQFQRWELSTNTYCYLLLYLSRFFRYLYFTWEFIFSDNFLLLLLYFNTNICTVYYLNFQNRFVTLVLNGYKKT